MSDNINHHKCRVAALARFRSAKDPVLVAAKQDLRAAKLAAHVAKVVAEAPPLSPAVLDRIASLLKPSSGGAS